MAMTEDRRCVVDTNVLIYSTVTGNPWYDEARNWLAGLHEDGFDLCVTTQILREYLVVLTRASVFETSFTVDQAIQELEAVLPSLTVFGESDRSAAQLRHLISRYDVRGKQIHDANIVAAMITEGVDTLATYNPGDFKRYSEVHLQPAPFA